LRGLAGFFHRGSRYFDLTLGLQQCPVGVDHTGDGIDDGFLVFENVGRLGQACYPQSRQVGLQATTAQQWLVKLEGHV